ncbi:MAG: mannose-1-phosphate guanylyltransferase [Gemmatimonadaceae bacterium]|nr:mannose-1-phosphate guanylyltransferase [Gemmatimonadaceae bacterium]
MAVIMAGGQGQRFWPLSTSERPKQFLDLERRGRTLIQATYDRLLPLVEGPKHVYVATGSRYVTLVREQLPDLPGDNLLIEPTGRDSAPAVALASLAIHTRTGGAMLGFFSADHRIGDEVAFRAAVIDAQYVAQAARGLVTLGITPTNPATAYGYIERGEAFGPGFRVASFVEKPTAERARRYLGEDTYSWNAGIFVWRSDDILAELDAHAPDIMVPLRAALAERRLAQVFQTLPKTSIDYALMERTTRAYVVPVDCDWDDIGDWVALDRLIRNAGPDATRTVVGKHVGHRASGNIIYTEDAEDIIVTVGVQDLIVVKRGNTVLLVAKDNVADIKAVLLDERLATA